MLGPRDAGDRDRAGLDVAPERGTSIREDVLIGPRATSRAVSSSPGPRANVVTFSSVTHLQAET